MKAFEHQESPESRLRVRAGELGKFGGNTGWGFGFYDAGPARAQGTAGLRMTHPSGFPPDFPLPSQSAVSVGKQLLSFLAQPAWHGHAAPTWASLTADPPQLQLEPIPQFSDLALLFGSLVASQIQPDRFLNWFQGWLASRALCLAHFLPSLAFHPGQPLQQVSPPPRHHSGCHSIKQHLTYPEGLGRGGSQQSAWKAGWTAWRSAPGQPQNKAGSSTQLSVSNSIS